MSKEDQALVDRMKELRELLSDFGLVLHGYDPGITAFVKDDPQLRGNGWAGEPISLNYSEWKWLEPLLKELRSRRKGEMALDSDKRFILLNALAYCWVRGWYAGLDGEKNDNGKRGAAKEELAKLLQELGIKE